MHTLHLTGGIDDVPSSQARRPPLRVRMRSSPNCTLKPSNNFEWHKTVLEMVTRMGIRHAKGSNPSRLSKIWQSLKHPKNSLIISKPDHSFGEHAVHYKELSSFKYQHDMVRGVLFDVCRCAGIYAKKETHVIFLTDPLDGRSTLRPADVLIFGWARGKHVCVYPIEVFPLVGLSSWGFRAALKAASHKVTKHEKACIKNQHVFVLFAFNTFGFLAPETVELFNRV
nr:putative reverse transcriptase domain-containing protein [Tanacetum cinerariifolium]